MRIYMMHKNTAFFLTELILVLAIISILAGMALPSYKTYIVKAKVIEALNVLNSYKLKIAEHYFEVGKLPNNPQQIFNGSSSVSIGKSNNIASVHYELKNSLALLSVKMKNPPKLGKDYVYVQGEIGGEFINWYCSSKNTANGIEEKHYPKSCNVF